MTICGDAQVPVIGRILDAAGILSGPGNWHRAEALVTNLALFEDAQRTATQLHHAAGSRALIDQAKGVIMQLRGCDAETAFDQLRAEERLA